MQLTIVLGFPRSGTSLISNILQNDVFYGGEPDQIRPLPEDTFESDLVISVNEHVLGLLKIDWLNPEDVKKAVKIDWQDPAVRSRCQKYIVQAQVVVNSLIRQIKGKEGKVSIYWKDPRMSILLPFWLQAIKSGTRDGVFDEPIEKINIIWCFRNPEESTDSAVDLFKNFNINKEQFSETWELYNGFIASTLASTRLSFLMIHYADIIKSPKKVITQLFKFLGEDASKERVGAAVEIVNPELYTYKSSKKKSLSNLYLRLIELCSKQTF